MVNLGMLSGFKYFNFFTDNVYALLNGVGFTMNQCPIKFYYP